MGHRRKGEPLPYRLHKQSGQAVVSLPLGSGSYQDVLLEVYDTPESRQEYARVIAEWVANGRHPTGPFMSSGSDLTVAELILAFLPHAEQHYRHPDGSPTGDLHDFKLSLRPLNHLDGPTPAKDFGPLAPKAVRQMMIDGYEHHKYGPQRRLCRGVVNQRIGRIRR